jgi:hydroxyethylthiazole kinase-like uncharacterized protein yjeF
MAEIYTASDFASSIPVRAADSNKGHYGHVLSLCGARGMAGAAYLAATAASISGAGLVTAAFPDCIEVALCGRFTEIMTLPLPSAPEGTLSADALDPILKFLKKATVLLMGCGLSQNEVIRDLLIKIIQQVDCPIVLDADGLNNLAKDTAPLKNRKAETLILTPHPGEMARLMSTTTKQIQENRENAAVELAAKLRAVVVLKGHQTLIADPNGNCRVNRTGNPGMAKGGSGDALAGITAGLLAQGMCGYDAASAAVYVHGLAGDKAAEKYSEYSMTASDLLQELKYLFPSFGGRHLRKGIIDS